GVAEYVVATGEIRFLESADHDLTGWPDPTGERLLLVDRVDGAETLRIRQGEDTAAVAMPEHALATWRSEPIWSADGKRLALTINSATAPDDVYVWSGTELSRLTDSAAQLPTGSLAAPEIHRVPAPDGEQIPCFLYRPENGDGSVVLIVHGGPESESVQSWNPVLHGLLQAGHAVAVPNVRGSTGYGKRWAALDDVRLRLDSVADLAAVHAWLPSVGLDPRRAALYGGSYGGYMVLAGLSMQPELWAAGIDIVGISSLVTFLENTSSYRRAYREREYGSIENDRDFLIEASPITHVDAMRAPLLIIHGANDPRVPLSEAEQIAAALRSRNIECELHVYADEGHGLSKLHNKLDAYPKAIEFLNRHLTSRP
ncbi:MAG TPA: S9 family peptidase, partial [Mycobacteriales bacterium]|nr:S9 family peptidase [Mycobacteriales bacterium]